MEIKPGSLLGRRGGMVPTVKISTELVYKIRRPDGKFKGHGRGVWTKQGKTWSSLNDLKGHLRLSERYPEGCTIVSYVLEWHDEVNLESFAPTL